MVRRKRVRRKKTPSAKERPGTHGERDEGDQATPRTVQAYRSRALQTRAGEYVTGPETASSARIIITDGERFWAKDISGKLHTILDPGQARNLEEKTKRAGTITVEGQYWDGHAHFIGREYWEDPDDGSLIPICGTNELQRTVQKLKIEEAEYQARQQRLEGVDPRYCNHCGKSTARAPWYYDLVIGFVFGVPAFLTLPIVRWVVVVILVGWVMHKAVDNGRRCGQCYLYYHATDRSDR